MNRRLRISSMLVPLLLTGCFLEQQTRVPEIKGRATRSGIPAQGIVVTLTKQHKDCSTPIQRTSTDANGHFFLQSVRELGVGKVFTSPELTYTVCLDAGAGAAVAWTQKSWGGPAPRTMSCDLARPWESPDQQTCVQQ